MTVTPFPSACASCRFWNMQDEHESRAELHALAFHRRYECRRHAPVAIHERPYTSPVERVPLWPPTRADDGCGDHAPL